MAFTRKMLKAFGIEDNIVEQIMDAHVEVVDGLKTERDTYKADSEKLSGVQKKLDDLMKTGGDWQKKYEDEHKDFEAYKNAQTAKETKSAKEKAYRELLKEAGISEKRIDTILKVTDLNSIELDDKGAVKDADSHKETVKTEYAEFVEDVSVRGAHVASPPARGGDKDLGSLSMSDYIAARSKK